MIHELNSLRPIVLNIGRKVCGRNWNYPDVQSPFTRVYFIINGYAQVATPRSVIELKPGQMYIIPAFTNHSCRCDNSFEHIYIHLYNEGSAHIFEDWNFTTGIETTEADLQAAMRLMALSPDVELSELDPRSYDNTVTLRRLIEINKNRPMADRIESRGLILCLLARFIRVAVPKTYVMDERIATVLEHIRYNLTQPPSIETLATLAHMGRDHFIRLFKKEIGNTPRAYINAKRIEQAQLLLITENMPVKEIAYTMGFDDQAYFNRLFRQHTGMTPQTYRRTVLLEH